eukprot:scaffold8103_cov166-Alexandrium_tamarense.AAC.3
MVNLGYKVSVGSASTASATAAALLLSILVSPNRVVNGFSPSSSLHPPSTFNGLYNRELRQNRSYASYPPKTTSRFTTTSSSSTSLHSSNDDNGDSNNEVQRLKAKADQYRKEAEQLRLTLELKKINELEHEIQEFVKKEEGGESGESSSTSTTDVAAAAAAGQKKKLDQLKTRVEGLIKGSVGKEEAEKMLSGLASFQTTPSAEEQYSISPSIKTPLPPLTDEEVKAAISFVSSLPKLTQDVLAKTAGYENYDSITNMEEFVQNLYQGKDVSSVYLRRTYGQSFAGVNAPTSSDEMKLEEYDLAEVSKMLASKMEESMETNRAMELFPRTLQDIEEDMLPTDEDAQTVFKLLDQNTFMAIEKPIKVSGGYLIRGKNKRKEASELLDAIDKKLTKESPEWTEKFQLNYVEITAEPNSAEFIEDALLLTPNNFPVLAPFVISGLTTAIALFSSFVYGIDTFSGNQVVMEKLKEASERSAGGLSIDITWFNEMLVPLLLVLGSAQGLHELGHYLVAWSNKIKLTPPTVLPSQALPYLSFQNRLKTSPKDYATLFDLAFVGPITGLAVSFLALLYGLELTTTIDSTTAQYLPSLSVGFLSQSSLGGTIVDLVLGGGDGILLNQEAATQIPLHPVAVGGFLGLIIHALDLLPIGSTDGGRMSQAILGRVWHLTFSSLVFFVLFVGSFIADDQGILLGYIFLYSFTQRDMEVPCRNEVDKANVPRVIAAVASWLIAALILIPLR